MVSLVALSSHTNSMLTKLKIGRGLACLLKSGQVTFLESEEAIYFAALD